MEIKAFMDGQETIESLEERLTGRYIAETIVDPDKMCIRDRAGAV